jgi:accessory gene regulator protein AgrB
MNKDTTFGRLLGLLFITLFVCLALYLLPDKILGYKIKKSIYCPIFVLKTILCRWTN